MSNLGEWIRGNFRGTPEKIASVITILVLTWFSITGIFGSRMLTENITSALCAILAVTTVLLHQLWKNLRTVQDTSEATKSKLDEVLESRSNFSIPDTHISIELDRMLNTARSWSFRGGSGRWQREAVLPRLSDIKDRSVPYTMLILDPTEPQLCSDYSHYRNIHRSDIDLVKSTAETVRNDLLACIVACAWYFSHTRLEPKIFLSQTFSPLRQDISDGEIAVTVADPSKEGLFVPSTSWYYEPLLDEFKQHCSRSPSLKFQRADTFSRNWTELTSADVEDALQCTYLQKNGQSTPVISSLDLTGKDLDNIRELVFKGRKD